ncbi:MAG TPA: GyrI-like domain-containing protein [Flavisolibacter sp.]|nr:GyrI-like domain-containing protein [Flavisolibacter sp.]
MRKGILIFSFLIIVFLVFVYAVIPSELKLDKLFFVNANQNTVYRSLTEKDMVIRWLKDTNGDTTNAYTKNNTRFRFNRMVIDLVRADVRNEDLQMESFIRILPVTKDSTRLLWTGKTGATKNPFKRIENYFNWKEANSNIDIVIEDLREFLSSEERVYGFTVNHAMVTDTLLITTAKKMNHYPTVPEYYAMIAQLREYAAASGARETNFPMLNVTQLNDSLYETRVGLPLDKHLKDKGAIAFRRMVAGKILIAEVRGGTGQVNQALIQMDNYLLEHGRVAPAIPFQSLVTDRSLQPDSANWITKIYYPVL